MPPARSVLVTGATGFIGRALLKAFATRGQTVVAASRQPPRASPAEMVEWRACDLTEPASLAKALSGIRVAYYLVHSMGGPAKDFRELEVAAARSFVAAAEAAGVERIVYLGGPAPEGRPSEHLRSRLEVGEILRGGRISSIELRASMVIGCGSASWQIVRDLAVRLPVMVLPRWLGSRTCPVALDDVIDALIAAAELPVAHSEWFDLPGPETMNGQQILERIAALRLRLVTRTDFNLARELVLGLEQDLLPKDARFWQLIGRSQLLPFDVAARRALAAE
jgi:uncharacterized protein YbjT (DUF2867 family)